MSAIYNLKNVVSKGLVYEFSNDENILYQYAQLVEQYYKEDLDLDLIEHNMKGGLVKLMKDEYVYIVRENKRVIAGAKINFVCLTSDKRLPMEEHDFNVDGYLPEDYSHRLYGEIGRLVVDPTYRGKDVLKKMISELMGFSIRLRCGYLFVLAPALNSVLYRRICRNLGVPITIHKEAKIPEKPLYRRLDIKLLSCDLQNVSGLDLKVTGAM